jgi:hypothetical protein
VFNKNVRDSFGDLGRGSAAPARLGGGVVVSERLRNTALYKFRGSDIEKINQIMNQLFTSEVGRHKHAKLLQNTTPNDL